MQKKTQKPLIYTGLFLVTCIGVLAASFFAGRNLSEIIRGVVSAGVGCGSILFGWESSAARGELSYDNARHPRRFFFGYLVSFVLAMFLPLIVADAWPFVTVYVMLGLFSSPFIGALSGTVLLMLTILVQGGSSPEFFMYVFAGFISLLLFGRLELEVQASLPLFISLMVQTVLLVCYHVMFLNESLSVGVLIVPLINAFINFALLIIILNAYSFYVVRRDAERFMEINDPAFALMLRIREKSEAEYQRIIHTDYLVQRAAAALDMDLRLIRTCTYYHRAAIVLEERDLEKNLALYREYHFPEAAIPLLEEVITHKKGELMSAEATVISLCETMIASLQYMFGKNKEAKLDYALLVDKIFEKKESEGEFLESGLSLRGLRIVREMLKKETLYYDFLR